MEPMYVSIRLPETGNHIKQLLKTNGYTVKDVQSAMGFENPQAIYKWMSGKSLPSLDNLVILSKILHSSMEDILVVDGDVVLYMGFQREGDERGWCRIFHGRSSSLFLHIPREYYKMRRDDLSGDKHDGFTIARPQDRLGPD